MARLCLHITPDGCTEDFPTAPFVNICMGRVALFLLYFTGGGGIFFISITQRLRFVSRTKLRTGKGKYLIVGSSYDDFADSGDPIDEVYRQSNRVSN